MPPERVILVGVGLKSEARVMTSSLQELRRLVVTAGGRIAESFSQTLIRWHPGTLIGSGKISELAAAVRELGANTVIFDNPLNAIQSYNLAKALGVRIMDRSEIIIEIFARRARSTA